MLGQYKKQVLMPDISAPVAKRLPHYTKCHGQTLKDPYHWLQDSAYPDFTNTDIGAYLKAENAYYEEAMRPHKGFIKNLFKEIKGRIQDDYKGVPWQFRDWTYQWRYEIDAEYCSWWCKPVSTGDDAWQCFLDESYYAKGCDFFRLSCWDITVDGRLLAYAVDYSGSERNTVRILDLESGEHLGEGIKDTLGEVLWLHDNQTLLYTRLDSKWRPWRLLAHQPRQSLQKDSILYEELDSAFSISLSRLKSDKYILLSVGNHSSSEQHLILASNHLQPPILIAPRKTGHMYDVDHANGRFYIRTNDKDKNFRIVSVPESNPNQQNWREEIPASDSCYLMAIEVFKEFYAIEEMVDGLSQIRLCDYHGNSSYIDFDEPLYQVQIGINKVFDSFSLRLDYSSLVTPETVYEYSLSELRLKTLKLQKIPSGYVSEAYTSERFMVPARDGVRIPVSIVYRRGFLKDGKQPLHMYGYGAYGYGTPPCFSSVRLSLLDRGVAYAIAHVRGGDELGYHWYETGKLKNRANSFNDFVDVARYLINKKYTGVGLISASGSSAGGELIGAAVNQDHSLWSAVLMHVPFVDVLNTMLNKDLPLTPPEWEEWGNPATDKDFFDYIFSYSPYDQIKAQSYPPMLVTGGLNDPRVTYWEPAKWVAKLRYEKTDNNPLLLKIDMSSGHGGKSGRYKHLWEMAEDIAFILLSLE